MFPDVWPLILFIYWGTATWLLIMAMTKPDSWVPRLIGISLVVVIFGAYPAKREYDTWRFRQYRDAAVAHFEKRCSENAGEHISRVVENVDGIFIARPRVKASDQSLRDQYWMGDPYGYSSYEADHPAATYLYDRTGETISQRRLTPIKGYRFVEMPNPDFAPDNGQGKYLRYSLRNVEERDGETIQRRLRPISVQVNALKSTFSITWDDVSKEEDRKYWVAGGSLKIIDLRSNKVIAERIGYVIDPQLGRVVQGRLIWLHVNRFRDAFCPIFETDYDKNKEFVAKVLQASRGVQHAD